MIQVIDVACAAKRAVDQSAEADRRCVELTELSRRAAEQAASVRDLAASLTQTASSVARVALDVCRYHNYQQAFEATLSISHRPPPIDVETFLSLVDNPRQTVGVATGSASVVETAAQRGVLGTCNEVDEMTMNYEHERLRETAGNDLVQSHHQTNTESHVCDESASSDDVAQLSNAVGAECLSSFFHSVSVPAMYVQSHSVLILSSRGNNSNNTFTMNVTPTCVILL